MRFAGSLTAPLACRDRRGDEINDGSFECLGIAVGGEIADDLVDEAMRSGFLSVEETLSFFASHGVEVGRDTAHWIDRSCQKNSLAGFGGRRS